MDRIIDGLCIRSKFLLLGYPRPFSKITAQFETSTTAALKVLRSNIPFD